MPAMGIKERGQAIIRAIKLGVAGTLITGLIKFATSLSPVSVGANTTAEQALTVTGLAVGDVIISINKPTAQAGLGIVGWRVSGANTLQVTFSNNTGSPIVPTAAETYQILVWRP
jgi:hypothetical protein